MSFTNLLIKNKVLIFVQNLYAPVRNAHWIRGKPPGVARTLAQRLAEENFEDPEVVKRINIGFPKLKPSRSKEVKERLAHMKNQRMNPELEAKARNKNLIIDLKQIEEDYNTTVGQYHSRTICDHYGIFNDLFGAAYFVPRVLLDIKYQVTEEVLHPVYNGNIIKPFEAAEQPLVSFPGELDPITGKKSPRENYWTLIATNPDGHFKSSDSEYIHWFIANIPNGEVDKGEVLVKYLQPFPPKGIGYQRFIFVLYKQNSKLDLSEYKVNENTNLEKRTFKTLDFYKKHQENITPAGLSFFQTIWDTSLTEFYHKVLDMKEPIFEYDFPKPYLSDQKWFPLKQPFNLYMDKHRDIKQINKEYLEKKLAKTHPFKGPETPLRFPNSHPIRGVPSWLKTEIQKDRLKMGRINDY